MDRSSPNRSASNEPLPIDLDFRALFEAAPGLYLVLLPDLRIAGASEAYLRATQTRREQIVGRGIFDVFPDNPDDPAATGVGNLRASLQRALATGKADTMAVQKYDIRRPESEGGGFEERFWSPLNTPVLGPDGRVRYIIHRVEDVTEFMRLKKLGGVAEELRSRAGLMEAEIFRRAQELQHANQRLREAEEATRRANELLEERVKERTHALAAANETLKAEMAERERVEAHFRQAQKMEALGLLAGGIAHDFNNLLTAILSTSRLVRDDLGPGHRAIGDLAEIEQAGTRAAALTRQLLAFSRKHVVATEVLSLNEIATGTERMLRRLLGEDIELVFVLEEELGCVQADRGHLEQVLMNLLVNARDAMPRGGRLVVETSNVELGDGDARGIIGARPGSYVALAVTDTGVGMDEATQRDIFLPFFTTKAVGKGTGLGLAMVHGVVKQAGGDIFLKSAPGQGTTFKLYFPRVEDAEAAEARRSAAAAALGGTESVLLVEDEAVVRNVTERVLRKGGYRVHVAQSPTAALALCAIGSHRFELLLTDVIMPGMDGPTLARALRTRYPGLKVVFMSGYTGGALLQQAMSGGEQGYLQKPFTPEQLLKKVREALDRG